MQRSILGLLVENAEVDLGGVARIERTSGPRGKRWLNSPYVGTAGFHWSSQTHEPERDGEDLIEAFGAEDATLSVTLEGRRKPVQFSLGEAFRSGRSTSLPDAGGVGA